MLRKPLLTTHEVGMLLKVKEATVRRWIRNRELPALLIGREWRIAAIQLEEFLKVRATVVQPMTDGSARIDEPAGDLEAGSGKRAKQKKVQQRRKRKSRGAS